MTRDAARANVLLVHVQRSSSVLARAVAALRNLERAGVRDHVDVVRGDGADVPAKTPDTPAGLVVLDAERPAYPHTWTTAAPRRVLKPYGVVAADNAVNHREQMAPFRDVLTADP
ncbi:hypothetical protein [Streptomyces sp. NPDC051636]|uniref:hypothetical protein n=1 Tax=Streptomyces sp. NPDC051636 TaxID=3365663 RepID=UPI00379AC79F